MKHILLPTDFSENSLNSISYALQLYQEERCIFYLLNVYTPVIYHMEYVLGAPAQFGLEDVDRNASQERLKSLLAKISEKTGTNNNHSFQTMSRFDSLISGIKEVMENHPIDLIVMGTKGATGAKEVLFGSNTVQVFKHVKCPILAIPSGYVYETPQNILFPTDLEVDYQNTTIALLKEIGTMNQSHIHIVHVSSGNDLTEVQNAHKIDLEKYLKNCLNTYHDVPSMAITDAINTFQVQTNANLLVMINNKHSFFENILFNSTINKIGFHLRIPFLELPSIL